MFIFIIAFLFLTRFSAYRNDLANIVRRRGHKQIQELLTRSSLNADVDILSAETSLDERLDATNGFEDPLAGQNETVDCLVNDVKSSTEFLLGSSSGSLYVDSSSSLGEGTNIAGEASANLFVEDGLSKVEDHAEVLNDVTEGNFYPTELIIVDNDYDSSREGLHPNFGSQSSIMPTEISGELPIQTVSSGNSESEDSLVGKMDGEITLSLTESHSNTSFNDSNIDTEDKEFSHLEPLVGLPLEQKDLGALEGLDDSKDDIAEDVATTSEVSVRENLSDDNRLNSIVHSADSSSTNLDTLANLSLREKVANFIQNGDLDPVEGTHLPEDNNVMAHGNSLTSNQVVPSGALDLDQSLWDDHLPHEDLTTDFNKDLDTEAPKVQNESEINHLKFMLYQKELELSRLKEQIEKEKLALSVLQTKAEAEISKARKLISEKDAELHVAEESLSGLKEVQIEFCGDGDVVEVAGSFNGWHHRIEMDLQQSTSAIDLDGSRSSRCWSTMLWLYPGVYEIKFVVDGKWITDPQRESVTRGHICNNILRVDR
ncbi:Protein PTST-like 3, chloroplastic isoform E [Glycine soja]|uniref:Protein PTST-like 3, chloroplastic isoform E n=1 Tax=Glycine soja TaxID=3848 RepID=A0A445HG08_GLYSO|nr:Protein PTST-like 3, chloroplastic isoform E [Glycine soja]